MWASVITRCTQSRSSCVRKCELYVCVCGNSVGGKLIFQRHIDDDVSYIDVNHNLVDATSGLGGGGGRFSTKQNMSEAVTENGK